MKIAVSTGVPAEWYRASGVLNPTFNEIVLKRLIKQVKKFQRDSLIHIGNSILWKIWHEPGWEKTGNPVIDESNFLAKRYATCIVSLAAVYSKRDGVPNAKEVDFRILVAEFNACLDSISYTSWKENSEIPRAQSRIAAYAYDTPLKRIPSKDFGKICADLFRVRMSSQQWQSYSFFDSDWTRASLIYKEFKVLANKVPGAALDAFEQRYLGTTFDRFIRSAWSLYAIVSGDAKTSKTPGFFDINQITIPEDLEIKLRISRDDLKIVSTRLSIPISKYPYFSNEIEETKVPIQKHAEVLDRLSKKPIITLDEYSEAEERILIPSPWKMLEAIKTFLLHEFVTSISEKQDEILKGRPAYSLRGDAFANYLRNIFSSKTNLIDLDKIDCGKGKKPDFLWLGQRYVIIIESKYRLKWNKDQKCLEPGTLIESWDTCLEAIDQADELLKRKNAVKVLDNSLSKKNILIIVTEESLPEETTCFKIAAKRWDWLYGTGLSSMALFTPAELEHFVFNSSADQLGEVTERIWNQLDPDAIDCVYRDTGVYNSIRTSPLLPHIQSEWNKLFPGMKLK